MEKGLFITIGVVAVVLAVILAIVYFTGGFKEENNSLTTDPNTKGIVLFYGLECPHCKDVEDFILANNIANTVNFTQSEVWHNKSNAQLLGQKVQICKITANTVGVPFLFDGNDKCYIGAPDVISFFKAQAGIQ